VNSRILVIGDIHIPYHHRDAFDFLSAIQDKLSPDKVISIGDELDYHAVSFHNSDPDLMSPGDELRTSIKHIKFLEAIFPRMDIVESNHGSLVYRKQKAVGLPSSVFKSYNQIYGVSAKWKWHMDMTIKMSNGASLYLCHGKTSNVLQLSQGMGMSSIQGHHHQLFSIQYWANSLGIYFAAQTGCLVDDDSLAMSYNNTNLKRPILGSLFIENGFPRLLPMVLNKDGRWVGKLYG
jgi:hypothetical protein